MEGKHAPQLGRVGGMAGNPIRSSTSVLASATHFSWRGWQESGLELGRRFCWEIDLCSAHSPPLPGRQWDSIPRLLSPQYDPVFLASSLTSSPKPLCHLGAGPRCCSSLPTSQPFTLPLCCTLI